MFIRYSILAFAFLAGALLSESVHGQSCSQVCVYGGGYETYPQHCGNVICNSQPVCGAPVYASPAIVSQPYQSFEIFTVAVAESTEPFGPQLPTESELSTGDIQPPAIKVATPDVQPPTPAVQWTSGPIFPKPGGC